MDSVTVGTLLPGAVLGSFVTWIAQRRNEVRKEIRTEGRRLAGEIIAGEAAAVNKLREAARRMDAVAEFDRSGQLEEEARERDTVGEGERLLKLLREGNQALRDATIAKERTSAALQQLRIVHPRAGDEALKLCHFMDWPPNTTLTLSAVERHLEGRIGVRNRFVAEVRSAFVMPHRDWRRPWTYLRQV